MRGEASHCKDCGQPNDECACFIDVESKPFYGFEKGQQKEVDLVAADLELIVRALARYTENVQDSSDKYHAGVLGAEIQHFISAMGNRNCFDLIVTPGTEN